MTTLTTRAGKGSPLTNDEMDANLNNLNNDKLEVGSPASSIAVTPVGGLTSTNVQAALSELDSEVTNKVVQTSTTGAAIIPTGSTAQRPSTPIEGHFRRNKELGQWEGYDGAQWSGIATGIRSSADGSKSYIQVGGTDRVTIGSQGIEAGSFKPGAIAANDLADGALIENSVNGIGYGPGAGGTVTQATSKSTAVTLNKPCGQITMNNEVLAPGATVYFTFNNSLLDARDLLVLNAGGYASNYQLSSEHYIGSALVFVKNIIGTSLSDTLVIKFAIIKGANS